MFLFRPFLHNLHRAMKYMDIPSSLSPRSPSSHQFCHCLYMSQSASYITPCFQCHFQSAALQTTLLPEETDLAIISLTDDFFHKVHKNAFEAPKLIIPVVNNGVKRTLLICSQCEKCQGEVISHLTCSAESVN